MIPIGHVIQKALKNVPAAKKIKEQLIVDAWSTVVGNHIAGKTEAVCVENGILLVRVNDSVWAQHLVLQKKQIMTKLHTTTKTRILTDIRFQVGTLRHKENQAANRAENNWRFEHLPDKEQTLIEEAFRGVDIPEDLANSMKAVFIAQKKLQQYAIKQGEPVCSNCNVPLVRTSTGSYCLFCKD